MIIHFFSFRLRVYIREKRLQLISSFLVLPYQHVSFVAHQYVYCVVFRYFTYSTFPQLTADNARLNRLSPSLWTRQRLSEFLCDCDIENVVSTLTEAFSSAIKEPATLWSSPDISSPSHTQQTVESTTTAVDLSIIQTQLLIVLNLSSFSSFP